MVGFGLLGPPMEEMNLDGDGVGWGSGSWVKVDGVGDGGGVSSGWLLLSSPEEGLSKAEAKVLTVSHILIACPNIYRIWNKLC